MAVDLDAILRAHPRTTHVDIYLAPKAAAAPSIFPLAWPRAPTLGGAWSRARGYEQQLIEYQHRDYTYVYDTANDAQRAFHRVTIPVSHRPDGPYYVMALEEFSLPIHRFPSTTDITLRREVTRWTTKINNRLQWIVEQTENGYVCCARYTHAANADLAKFQEDLHQVLHTIKTHTHS
jgi:hypothetical protein